MRVSLLRGRSRVVQTLLAFVIGIAGLAGLGGLSPQPADAAQFPVNLQALCFNTSTGLARGSLTPNCNPNEYMLNLNTQLPATICVHTFTGQISWGFGGCSAGRTAVVLNTPADLTGCFDMFTGAVQYATSSARCGCNDGVMNLPPSPGNAEAEPNNSFATAQQLKCFSSSFNPLIDDPYGNNISTSTTHASVAGTGNGTVDYYRFTVSQAFTTSYFDTDTTNFDTYLILFDNAGNELTRNDDNSGDAGSPGSLDSFIVHTFFTPGTYIIGVGRFPNFSPINPGSTYTLHVSLELTATAFTDLEAGNWSLDFDPDINDASNANTSTVIPHVSVNGVGSGGLDWYRVVVPAAGATGIFDIDYGYQPSDGLQPDDFDPYIRLFDASGTFITQDDDQTPFDPGSEPDGFGGDRSFDSLIEIVFPAPGTYYLAVGRFPNLSPIPAGGTYTLHVSIEGHAT